jgi:hypothetical protein
VKPGGVARAVNGPVSHGVTAPHDAPPPEHDTTIAGGEMSAERERLAALETQMKELKGNGQPGRIDRIEEKLDKLSARVYIGLGLVMALQFLALAGQLRFLKP